MNGRIEVPKVATVHFPKRVVVSCVSCCLTLRAPMQHPAIDAFRDEHMPHGDGVTKVSYAHANVWTEEDAMARLKAELSRCQQKLAAQRDAISRLENSPHSRPRKIRE